MVDAKRAKAAGKRRRAGRPPGEEILHGKDVHLDPRKSPFWQMEFDLYGTTHRKTTGHRDLRKAERFAREYRDARTDEHVRIHGKRGVPDRPRDGRLDEAVDAFWAREAHKDAGAGDTKTRFVTLVEILGPGTLLSRIDDQAVWQLIAGLEARDAFGDPGKGKLSDDRVDAHVKLLRRLMNDAVKVRKFHLPDMPNWTALTLPDQPRTRVFSLEEADAIFEAWRPDTRPAAKFLFESGLRLTNAIELRWDQLDPDLTTITVKVKAPKSRRRRRRKLDARRLVKQLPVTPAMRAILLAERGKHPVAVFTFVARQTGRVRNGAFFERGKRYPLLATSFQQQWYKVLGGTAIEDARPHDFRRTRGSLVLRVTGDITKAQKVLHHARVATTAEHYAHVAPPDVLEAMVRTSEYEAAWRAGRARRPLGTPGALPPAVAGSPEDLPEPPSGKGATPWPITETSSPSPIPRPSEMPASENSRTAWDLGSTHCEEKGFRLQNSSTDISHVVCEFHRDRPKTMVREANPRTFPELTATLDGLDARLLESGASVVHQGVRGRFREIRQKVACRLDEAFEPTATERLRKAGHTIWAFEPEGGEASDQVVVLGLRHQLAVRDDPT